MGGIGKMGIMGRSLDIDFEECDWFITIRRADGERDASFAAMNEQEVRSPQIAYFVPNWQNLEWQRVRLEDITEEAYIQDGDYRLNLICPKESRVDSDAAILEFKEFMTNDLKQMQDKIKDELEHIPDGPEPQNELRLVYCNRRTHCLSKKVMLEQTAKQVLEECISRLKQDHPDFEFRFDKSFFRP